LRERRRRELRACRPREPRQARTLPEPCTARSWEACRPGRMRARRARDAGPRSRQDAGAQNRSDAGQQAAGPAWTQDAVEAADGIDLLLTDAALGVLRASGRTAPCCSWPPGWPGAPGMSPGRRRCSAPNSAR